MKQGRINAVCPVFRLLLSLLHYNALIWSPSQGWDSSGKCLSGSQILISQCLFVGFTTFTWAPITHPVSKISLTGLVAKQYVNLIIPSFVVGLLRKNIFIWSVHSHHQVWGFLRFTHLNHPFHRQEFWIWSLQHFKLWVRIKTHRFI